MGADSIIFFDDFDAAGAKSGVALLTIPFIHIDNFTA